MKTIITYGTFDLFHRGHLNLLKNLKKMGDELIVAVSTDAFNTLKGKETFVPFEQRKNIIRATTYADRVIAEENWEQKIQDIEEYSVSTFAIGEDWKGKFDFLKEYCEVVYLPRTKGVSSSRLKKYLNTIRSPSKDSAAEMIKVSKVLKGDL